jgi:hypothetical protein
MSPPRRKESQITELEAEASQIALRILVELEGWRPPVTTAVWLQPLATTERKQASPSESTEQRLDQCC